MVAQFHGLHILQGLNPAFIASSLDVKVTVQFLQLKCLQFEE